MPTPLKQIKGFLVDLDGTTYIGNQALPGAVDFFTHLHAQHIPYLFFSNNPTKHVEEYVEHITAVGIPVTAEQIITSTHATIAYLNREKLTQVYIVGTPGFEKELADAGITHTELNPQAVVISFDTTLTYNKIQTASSLLLNNPALPYIATNPDLVCPTPDGPIPDCGALIALLQAVTKREPLVMGKPHTGMIALAEERLGLPRESLAVIGDRLYTDIKMGIDHGLATVLVLSGETNAEDVEHAAEQPDVVVNTIGELISLRS